MLRLILLLMILLSGVLVAQTGDVRVISSDNAGVTLEYLPRYESVTTVNDGGAAFVRLSVRGCTPAPGQKAGDPQLFLYPATIQLPGEAGNKIEIVASEYTDTSDILLEPVPSFHRSEAGPLPVFSINPESYGRDGFIPASIDTIDNVGETRRTILGTILLSPYQYNPVSKTLRKYTRIVVHVTFGSSTGFTRTKDNLLKNVALNEGQFARTEAPVRTVKAGHTLRSSLLASGSWFSFPITSDGIYKITGSTLLSAGFPSSTNPLNIKLYNNGGTELPNPVTESYTDDLTEIAVFTIDVTGNGLLDADDYIIFFGKSVRGWKYNKTKKTFSHYINHYAKTNVYWVTAGSTPSKQMASLQFSSGAPTILPRTVGGKYFREDEKINVVNSGLEWLGQQFNVLDASTYVSALPGLDVSQPITYNIVAGAQSKGTSYFTIYEHSNLLKQTSTIPATDIDNYGLYFRATNPAVQTVSLIPSFADEQSQLRFVFSSTNSNGYGFLNWFEIFYQAFPAARSNLYTFHTIDTAGIVRYRIPGFSDNQVYVFDVTKFDSVCVQPQPALAVDTCTVTVEQSAGTVRELYVIGKQSIQAVTNLTSVANQDLHGDTTTAEEIIITNDEFMPAAQRLKAHRERVGSDMVRTMIVSIDEIYNEFGGGLPSPQAVRNYLRYLSSNWSVPPSYLLLFGDGDFDYRNILTQRAGKIPVWETGIEFHPIDSYVTDDEFVILNTSRRVSMGVGRIPVQSLSEAQTVVEKIIEYETGGDNNIWKLTVTLVADDGWIGEQGSDGYLHARDAESLSVCVPKGFLTKKIFLHEYPVVYTANGRRKPAVNVALRDQINAGTALLNYAGHGNPRLWAHEQVFVRETDFSLLSNKGKYFFLVAATCNYGAMDMLNEQSGGELLLLLPEAGAIATYCATRPVISSWNYDLNEALYKKLFATNTAGQVLPRRLGDVIYQVRQDYYQDNDRKYILFGDPALRIVFPKLSSTIDSLNGQSLNQTAQLQALNNAEVIATVRDTSDALITSFNGTGETIVYDANRTVTITDANDGTFTYKTNGNVIFRGSANIENGTMRTSFIVPKDISYTNEYGRVMIYFSDGTTNGSGYTTNVRIGGTDSTAGTDTEGPAIRLYFDSRTFRSGDVVSASPLLIAELEDEHGINTSGAGVGHRIEAWIDDNPESIDLTLYYKSNIDTYREGVVEYNLGTLSPGSHHIRVRAWDTYNNSSQTQTTFDVSTGVGLHIAHAFNFPNPFSSSTVFSIEHNQYEHVDAEVKIYTVAGRLIQTLDSRNIGSRIVNISWDGRDRDGNRIANGIYLYKAIVKTVDGRLSGEVLGKLSVLQ